MPTKLQVVVFVQGIVPSSFTHESSLRCYGLFGIGIYQVSCLVLLTYKIIVICCEVFFNKVCKVKVSGSHLYTC